MIVKPGMKFLHKEWIETDNSPVVCEIVRHDYTKERIYFKALSNEQLYWVRDYWFKRDTFGKRVK